MSRRLASQLPFVIGTDVVQISRIQQLIFGAGLAKPRNRLRSFLTRILHPSERCDFNKRFPGFEELAVQGKPAGQSSQSSISQWLAGRWAAKEAAKKAWGATNLTWKNVRVEVCNEGGAVHVVCQPSGAKGDSLELSSMQAGKLSISHDGDYAVAMVLAAPLEKKSGGPQNGDPALR